MYCSQNKMWVFLQLKRWGSSESYISWTRWIIINVWIQVTKFLTRFSTQNFFRIVSLYVHRYKSFTVTNVSAMQIFNNILTGDTMPVIVNSCWKWINSICFDTARPSLCTRGFIKIYWIIFRLFIFLVFFTLGCKFLILQLSVARSIDLHYQRLNHSAPLPA